MWPFKSVPTKDIVKWNSRAAFVYGFGVWTLLGSLGYLVYSGKMELTPEKRAELKEKQAKEEARPNVEVHRTTYSKTVITFKEDFVPYTTRIMNFINSFSADSKK